MSQTYADIIIDISHSAIDRVFQYRIGDAWKEQVQVGSLVTVPFGKGNAHRHGYVIGITQTPSYEPDKIKEIVDVPQKGLPIEGKLIQLAAWMRETYGTTMNQALQTVMPVKQTVRKTAQKVEETTLPDTNWEFVTLNDEQQALVDAFAEDIQAGERHTYLLHGVTGSGKTEVYIQCIKEVIRESGDCADSGDFADVSDTGAVPKTFWHACGICQFQAEQGREIRAVPQGEGRGSRCCDRSPLGTFYAISESEAACNG